MLRNETLLGWKMRGGRMYLSKPTKNGASVHPFYTCDSSARGDACGLPADVRACRADEHVETEFLRVVGPVQTTHVVEIPGDDPEPELLATLAEFREHQEQQGRQKSKHTAAEWQRRADALDNRVLLSPPVPDRQGGKNSRGSIGRFRGTP
ncbi:hypothetical protein ACIP6P_05950 [Streptomyces sp. NPDC088729]|uniref:hypothetical protein n=1 Tax=Streptomyces sp. NPDC088729 TaxID=3365876 RepID=UPI00382F5F7B